LLAIASTSFGVSYGATVRGWDAVLVLKKGDKEEGEEEEVLIASY